MELPLVDGDGKHRKRLALTLQAGDEIADDEVCAGRRRRAALDRLGCRTSARCCIRARWFQWAGGGGSCSGGVTLLRRRPRARALRLPARASRSRRALRRAGGELFAAVLLAGPGGASLRPLWGRLTHRGKDRDLCRRRPRSGSPEVLGDERAVVTERSSCLRGDVDPKRALAAARGRCRPREERLRGRPG